MRALVLKKIPYSEKDWVIQFLLETGEVRSAFAAGARHSKRRFPHQFDQTGLYEVEFKIQSEKLPSLQRCELLNHHEALAADLVAYTRWALILEWVSADAGWAQSFDRLLQIRDSLTHGDGLWAFHFFFLNQMRIHGVQPQADLCMICEEPLTTDFAFHSREGRFTHPSCLKGESLKRETCEAIRAFFADDEPSYEILAPLFSLEVLKELDQISVPYLEEQLGRSLKAHKFFKELGFEL